MITNAKDIDDRRHVTDDRRQVTEDRRRMTDVYCLMPNA